MRYAIIVLSLLTLLVPAASGQSRFDVGLRAAIGAGTGEPTNDVPSVALFGHYRLSNRWALGMALDHANAFDVERPAEIVGVRQDQSVETIDSKAESTTASLWVERLFTRQSRHEFFLGSGIGYASIDAPVANGPRDDGGTFEIAIDAGSEVVVSALAGWRMKMGSRLMLELGVRADEHFGDWKLEDRVSGASGKIGNYFTYGAQVGLLFRY